MTDNQVHFASAASVCLLCLLVGVYVHRRAYPGSPASGPLFVVCVGIGCVIYLLFISEPLDEKLRANRDVRNWEAKQAGVYAPAGAINPFSPATNEFKMFEAGRSLAEPPSKLPEQLRIINGKRH